MFPREILKSSNRTEDKCIALNLRLRIRKQDETILQLQKDNTVLKSELEQERGIVQIYIDRLQRLEEQWMRRIRTLRGLVKDVHHAIDPKDSPLSEINNEERSPDIECDLEESSTSPQGDKQEDFQQENTSNENQVVSEIEIESEETVLDQAHPSLVSSFHQNSYRNESSENEVRCQRLSTLQNQTEESPFARARTARLKAYDALQRTNRNETNTLDNFRQCTGNRTVLQRSHGTNHLEIPGLDWTQRLLLIRESYEKRKALFEDDLSFIREVHCGYSLAPEMDLELELKNLSRAFKSWKTTFKEEIKSTELQVKQSQKCRRIISAFRL